MDAQMAGCTEGRKKDGREGKGKEGEGRGREDEKREKFWYFYC